MVSVLPKFSQYIFNKLLLDSPFITSRFKNQILHKLMFKTQEIVFKVQFFFFFLKKKKCFVCFNIKGKTY